MFISIGDGWASLAGWASVGLCSSPVLAAGLVLACVHQYWRTASLAGVLSIGGRLG